jgi:hypothetical protein
MANKNSSNQKEFLTIAHINQPKQKAEIVKPYDRISAP